MTIPDSLQTLGYGVFHECFKLVPSNIDVREYDGNDEELLDTTSEVVNYLRAKNLPTKEFVGSKYFQTYLLLPYFTGDMLTTMKLVSKAWLATVNDFIDEAVGKGEMFCHGGGNYNHDLTVSKKSTRERIIRVIFPLNIKKVGDRACKYANLIIVDIPEGVEIIRYGAFSDCESLTTVSFPKTLTTICHDSFYHCKRLLKTDLFHINLQQLGNSAFGGCSNLKLMTIPDSLQTFGRHVFYECFKLVSFSINVGEEYNDSTPKVVAYLRAQQLLSATK